MRTNKGDGTIKMSYAEVVNNLELAIRRYKDATHHVSCIVDINILKEAFDTIKEQKAEIERLKDSVITSNIMETQRIKRDVKLEVIKDFENKLKEKKTQSTMDKRIYSADMIDNIIKEMMEVETNPRKEDVGK